MGGLWLHTMCATGRRTEEPPGASSFERPATWHMWGRRLSVDGLWLHTLRATQGTRRSPSGPAGWTDPVLGC
eukprot:351851-Chlamydomonas_euryale.AAC.6